MTDGTHDTGNGPVLPSADAGPRRWGVLGSFAWAVLSIVLALIAEAIAVGIWAFRVGYRSAREGRSPDLDTEFFEKLATSGDVTSLSQFLGTPVGLLVIWTAVRLRKGSTFQEYLGWRDPGGQALIFWSFAALFCALATDVVGQVLEVDMGGAQLVEEVQSAEWGWMLVVAVVVLAPLSEETLFRGFLFEPLRASVAGPVATVLLTASIWTFIHVQYDFPTLCSLFLLGVLLGTARVRTNSLVVPLVMHGCWNAGALAAAWLIASSP
ncbi:MAG: type II CAAX endopeptidase family protein [Myxococcota bacterium]